MDVETNKERWRLKRFDDELARVFEQLHFFEREGMVLPEKLDLLWAVYTDYKILTKKAFLKQYRDMK